MTKDHPIYPYATAKREIGDRRRGDCERVASCCVTGLHKPAPEVGTCHSSTFLLDSSQPVTTRRNAPRPTNYSTDAPSTTHPRTLPTRLY